MFKILIVEDEIFNIELYKEMLEDKYDLLIAENGQKAGPGAPSWTPNATRPIPYPLYAIPYPLHAIRSPLYSSLITH